MKKQFIILPILICLLYSQRTITEEAQVFNKSKHSVFTVFGDRGHGSGFLIDSKGLIITNNHVINESKYLRVQINDSLKYECKLVSSNPVKDIAILYINPEAIKDIEPLLLATQGDSMVFIGEKVVAIGSPLNQKKILTSGIVSGVEETVIFSDVNMNPGNSGGPLINMDYDVIGINTFGDFSDRGPGIYGSLNITEAMSVIEAAYKNLNSAETPSMKRFPVESTEQFPLEGLKEVIERDTFDEQPYRLNSYQFSNFGDFEIYAVTPPYHYYREKRMEKRLADRRNKRENSSGQSPNTYDLYKDLKNWASYLGHYKPIVQFEIYPKIGRTSRSTLFNLFSVATSAAFGTSATYLYEYEYKGDLTDFQVVKDAQIIEPIRRELIWKPLVFSSSVWKSNYQAEDLAQAGIYTFPIELFEPEITYIGDSLDIKMPDIWIKVHDLKSPNEPYSFQLPDKLKRKILSDFSPYLGNELLNNHLEQIEEAERLEKIKLNNESQSCLFAGGMISIVGLFVFSFNAIGL